MQNVQISSMYEFDQLQENWNDIYEKDNNTHVFNSWSWMKSFLPITEFDWLILGVRSSETSKFVAFAPFTLQSHRFGHKHTLHFGGYPFADYTGFLCHPDFESEAMHCLAEAVHNLKWDYLNMNDVKDDRFEKWLQNFSADKYQIHRNSTPCPYLHLPSDWDEYLQQHLSKSRRKKVRRYWRKIENLQGYRVTQATKETADLHINTLMKLWEERWGTTPLPFATLMHNCLHNKCLHLEIMWQENTPIAAAAVFTDPVKKTIYDYIGGFNLEYGNLSPGMLLVARMIHYAIQHGFTTYDLLRGDESYKSSFGTMTQFSQTAVIERRTLKNSILQTINKLRS